MRAQAPVANMSCELLGYLGEDWGLVAPPSIFASAAVSVPRAVSPCAPACAQFLF